MPNRILKESICTSDTVDQLSADEERCFTRMIVHVDDFGLMDARLAVIRAKLFPLKTDQITLQEVGRWLQGMRDAGAIVLYVVNGRPFLKMPEFKKHQGAWARAKVPRHPLPEQGHIVERHPELERCQCKQSQADAGDGKQMHVSYVYEYEYGSEVSHETSSRPLADEASDSASPQETAESMEPAKLPATREIIQAPEPDKAPETVGPKRRRSPGQHEADEMIRAIAEVCGLQLPLNSSLLKAASKVGADLRQSGVPPDRVGELWDALLAFLPKGSNPTFMALPRHVGLLNGTNGQNRAPPVRAPTGDEILAAQKRQLEELGIGPKEVKTRDGSP